jgi:hypothetical protein
VVSASVQGQGKLDAQRQLMREGQDWEWHRISEEEAWLTDPKKLETDLGIDHQFEPGMWRHVAPNLLQDLLWAWRMMNYTKRPDKVVRL